MLFEGFNGALRSAGRRAAQTDPPDGNSDKTSEKLSVEVDLVTGHWQTPPGVKGSRVAARAQQSVPHEHRAVR